MRMCGALLMPPAWRREARTESLPGGAFTSRFPGLWSQVRRHATIGGPDWPNDQCPSIVDSPVGTGEMGRLASSAPKFARRPFYLYGGSGAGLSLWDS